MGRHTTNCEECASNDGRCWPSDLCQGCRSMPGCCCCCCCRCRCCCCRCGLRCSLTKHVCVQLLIKCKRHAFHVCVQSTELPQRRRGQFWAKAYKNENAVRVMSINKQQ